MQMVFLLIATAILALDTHHRNAAFSMPHAAYRPSDVQMFRREKEQKPKTFEDPECLTQLMKDGISLVNYGITRINSSIDLNGRFYEALEDLYNSNESVIKNIVLENLKIYNSLDSKSFELGLKTNLEKAAVYPYTGFLYQPINSCLRSHICGKKELTEREKYLGPYAAYLMAVLMYSKNLTVETNQTYRFVRFTSATRDQYEVGTKFIWTSFTSSSSSDGLFKGNTKFIFNNSRTFITSPRRVAQYSNYPDEEEALYPPTAMFKVTAKELGNEYTSVYVDFIKE